MANSSSNRSTASNCIVVRGARAHNLKSVDLDVPYYRLTTFCGVSGSGKSSMALDVLYAEGRRRFVECFSPNVRARLEKIEKPDVDLVEGTPPAVAVDATPPSNLGASTLGATTEISAYLRELYARVGVARCACCGRETRAESPDVVLRALERFDGARAMIALAPPAASCLDQSQADFEAEWREKGLRRAIVRGASASIFDLDDPKGIPREYYQTAAFLIDAARAPSEDELLANVGFRRQSAPSKYQDRIEEDDESEEDAELESTTGALMLDPEGDYSRVKRYFAKRADVFKKTSTPRIFLVVDRVKLSSEAKARIYEAVETSYLLGSGECWVFVEGERRPTDGDEASSFGEPIEIDATTWTPLGFSAKRRCAYCGVDFPELTPNLFNSSSRAGACGACGGLGYITALDEDLIFPDKSLTLQRGAIAPWRPATHREKLTEFLALADRLGVRTDAPFSELTLKERKLLFNGSISLGWSGLNGFFAALMKEKHKMHARVFLSRFQRAVPCLQCDGARLCKEALSVQVDGRNIRELEALSARRALEALENLSLSPTSRALAKAPLESAISRLRYLEKVGLGYLSLDRPTRSLSSGEQRRASLTKALGSDLVDMLYVLDEPSDGLHPSDCEKLLQTIVELRDRGNTVIVVDHNETILRGSDRVVEFGPEAGAKGGRAVFEGTPEEMEASTTSLTGSYLAGKRATGAAPRREISNVRSLEITGATGWNLKNVSATFPLNALVAIVGVSGAGKSALARETLYPALCARVSGDPSAVENPLPYATLSGDEFLEEVALVDQTPIGRSPRSNPATFLKIFDDVRALYADTPEAKARGWNAGLFSFNVDGGRCKVCKGEGVVKTDMQFMSDVYARCPVCNGTRYQKRILEARIRGLNIAEALELTAAEAFVFFRGRPKIQQKLKKMIDVGLGYLPIGQSCLELSGGESQRLKLALYLTTPRKSGRLFIIDEPTSGLHFADVVRLIDCFNEIVDVGNSVIVVDHNPLLAKSADYVIEIGPGAGEDGGRVVAEGRPEEIARRDSPSGRALARELAKGI